MRDRLTIPPGPLGSTLINTPLQRGEWAGAENPNRFNGFPDSGERATRETAEAVQSSPGRLITALKRGVNEKQKGEPSLRGSASAILGLCLALFLRAHTAFAADKVTFQDQVLPLIQANCAKCHNEDKRKGDLDLTSYQNTLKGGGDGPVVVSGNPEASKLWKCITQAEDPTMPPNRGPLPDKELEVFKKWIQGGLLENAGGKAVVAAQAGTDFTLKADAVGKSEGPPPMPQNLPPVAPVHTTHTTAITGLAASPWAPLVAVAGQKQVLLFHSETLQLLGVLPFTEGEPVGVKFSRSGQLLLACGGRAAQAGRVVLWDVASGKKLATLGDDYDSVLAADIRPDQSQVAFGGPGRLVKLVSARTGELQQKMRKHTDWVTAVAYSPNGRLLASADRNGGISLWDPDSGQELFTLAGHKSAVTALSWRSDSRLLASSSEDGTVKLWETEDGKQVKSWNAHGPGTLCVSYAHTDRLVTCGRDGAVRLWDGSGKKLKELEKASELPLRVSFSSDGARVIGSDFEGRVTIWTVETGKRVGNLDTNPLPGAVKLASVQNRPNSVPAR